MPNIFDGLKRVSDEHIIEQIALLETINMTNISKPIAQKAKKKTISIINFISSKIGRDNVIEEPEVKEIWTLIDERKEELKTCPRSELDECLLEILIEKIKSDMKDPTEDEISIEIIEEAAKLYDIDENLTPSQKANEIYWKYSKKINGKPNEQLKEESIIELKHTTENIENILKNMDEQQKKNFEQAMDLEKVTLLNAWRKMDRQLFTRIIWLAVNAFGGKFTPDKEMLPSFVEGEKEIFIIEREKKLGNLKDELLKLKNEIKANKEKINSIENNIKEKSDLFNNAMERKNEAEEDIIDLEKNIVDLAKLKKIEEDRLTEIEKKMEGALLNELDSLMEEFKKVKFDIVRINNKISDVNIEIAYKNKLVKDKISELEESQKIVKKESDELQQSKLERNNLIKIYDEKKEEIHRIEDDKRNDIFERWSKFFNRFIFEFKDLKNVINFTREELLQIEECLYELHCAKDPMALSMGIMEEEDNKEDKDEYQYIDVCFSNEFQVEIQYKVLKNEEKNVHIVEITNEF